MSSVYEEQLYNQEIDKLKSQIIYLKEYCDGLTETVITLRKERDELRKDLNKLQGAYNELRVMYFAEYADNEKMRG